MPIRRQHRVEDRTRSTKINLLPKDLKPTDYLFQVAGGTVSRNGTFTEGWVTMASFQASDPVSAFLVFDLLMKKGHPCYALCSLSSPVEGKLRLLGPAPLTRGTLLEKLDCRNNVFRVCGCPERYWPESLHWANFPYVQKEEFLEYWWSSKCGEQS